MLLTAAGCHADPAPAPAATPFVAVVTPENALAFRFVKDGAWFGSLDMLGWGPNWAYAPPSSPGLRRGRRAVGDDAVPERPGHHPGRAGAPERAGRPHVHLHPRDGERPGADAVVQHVQLRRGVQRRHGGRDDGGRQARRPAPHPDSPSAGSTRRSPKWSSMSRASATSRRRSTRPSRRTWRTGRCGCGWPTTRCRRGPTPRR